MPGCGCLSNPSSNLLLSLRIQEGLSALLQASEPVWAPILAADAVVHEK